MMRGAVASMVVVLLATGPAWVPVRAQAQTSEPEPESEQASERTERETVTTGEPDLFGPLLMMSLGAGSFVAGLIVYFLGVGDRSAVEDAPVGTPWDEVAYRADRAPAVIGIGSLMIGAGVVILAGGVTWLGFALAGMDESEPTAATLRLEVAPAGASLRGRF
ncbi:MAG: hypothetical protein DRJ42_23795 [Deltaproteobacteria bacterium]|nr:MAG: hypothetical protein DRJ42_23795 [Deltaproteobacteria bacterium]